MTTETVTKKKVSTSQNLKEPGRFKVIVMNDDVTPVEFVVAMFVAVFNYANDQAFQLTMKVHNEGSAVAGTYTYEIAEQKCIEAVSMARANGYPLTIKVEAA